MCMRRRFLPGGVCGETIKRKTVEKDVDDELLDDAIRIKGKALRNLETKKSIKLMKTKN